MQYKEWLEQSKFLPGIQELPKWFREKQESAFSNWQSLDPPVIERLNYSNWLLFQEVLASEQASITPLTYLQQGNLNKSEENYIQIVHAGNQTEISHIPTNLQNDGIIVSDLFEALREYPDLIQEKLFSVIQDQTNRMTAYHTAYLNGGLFIYIPDNLDYTVVIESLILQDSRFSQACNKHILIVVGANSQVEYTESLQTEGSVANAATIMVEVIAEAGSNIKYCALDALAKQTTAYIKRYGQANDDATIDWAVGVMNEGRTIVDLDTYLDGNGSESQLAIIAISSDDQTQVIDSKVVNRGRHSIGNILQHGVILDQATLTFNGIGLIEKQAKFADAQQESRIMMLSDKARGDANPILLIEEFEVTAGHAASVGQLDEGQLYYLMSRGLKRKEAEYLVLRGFLAAVINNIPSLQVRERMVAIIDHKLQKLK